MDKKSQCDTLKEMFWPWLIFLSDRSWTWSLIYTNLINLRSLSSLGLGNFGINITCDFKSVTSKIILVQHLYHNGEWHCNVSWPTLSDRLSDSIEDSRLNKFASTILWTRVCCRQCCSHSPHFLTIFILEFMVVFKRFIDIHVLIPAMHSRTSLAAYRYPILVVYRFDCNTMFQSKTNSIGRREEGQV